VKSELPAVEQISAGWTAVVDSWAAAVVDG